MKTVAEMKKPFVITLDLQCMKHNFTGQKAAFSRKVQHALEKWNVAPEIQILEVKICFLNLASLYLDVEE